MIACDTAPPSICGDADAPARGAPRSHTITSLASGSRRAAAKPLIASPQVAGLSAGRLARPITGWPPDRSSRRRGRRARGDLGLQRGADRDVRTAEAEHRAVGLADPEQRLGASASATGTSSVAARRPTSRTVCRASRAAVVASSALSSSARRLLAVVASRRSSACTALGMGRSSCAWQITRPRAGARRPAAGRPWSARRLAPSRRGTREGTQQRAALQVDLAGGRPEALRGRREIVDEVRLGAAVDARGRRR